MRLHEKELWKDIPQTNGCYQASNVGRIRRIWVLKPWKTAKPSNQRKNTQQREVIAMRMIGSKKNWLVHRLVAAAFLGLCPEGMEVNHIDGNALNNRAANLEYVTRRQNLLHAFRIGLITPRRKMKTCPTCGAEFYGKNKFCGRTCDGLRRRRRTTRMCVRCGKEFARKKSKDGPYCSRSCYALGEDRPTDTASLFR